MQVQHSARLFHDGPLCESLQQTGLKTMGSFESWACDIFKQFIEQSGFVSHNDMTRHKLPGEKNELYKSQKTNTSLRFCHRASKMQASSWKIRKNNFTWSVGSHYYFSDPTLFSKLETTQVTHYASIQEHPPSLCLIAIRTLSIGGRLKLLHWFQCSPGMCHVKLASCATACLKTRQRYLRQVWLQ